MAEDHIPTAEEYALFREAYAETYPVRPLLNAIDALEEENARLRAALKRYEDLEIHLSTGGKPDERVYTRKDVEMLVAVCRAGERAAFELHPGEGDNRAVSTEGCGRAATVSGTPESYSCSDPRQDARTSAGDGTPSPVLHAHETRTCTGCNSTPCVCAELLAAQNGNVARP